MDHTLGNQYHDRLSFTPTLTQHTSLKLIVGLVKGQIFQCASGFFIWVSVGHPFLMSAEFSLSLPFELRVKIHVIFGKGFTEQLHPSLSCILQMTTDG